MTKEAMVETLSIAISVAKGYCDECKCCASQRSCLSDYRLVLPIDTNCTIMNNKIIKTLYEGEE